MNDLRDVSEIRVRSLGFNIPCRQFIVEAQVTRDKRMPMVDEFVLRVIHLCEGIPAPRLRTFFGFNEPEMQVVLADLQARGLVVAEGDSVRLHEAGKELFRTAGDGAPQIVEVEEWVNRVWFDLITQSMIVPSSLRNIRNLIELKPQAAARDNVPAEFARNAFQSNFKEYLQNVRKIKNSEHLTLYAITSVQPERFSYAQLTGKQVLRLGVRPRLESTLDLPDVERPQRVRQLTDAMTQALAGCADPEPSFNARTEFSRLTGSDALLTSEAGVEFVDLAAWAQLEAAKADGNCSSFIGSIYLEENRRALTGLIERLPQTVHIRDEDTVDVLWFRPGGSLWGTSDELRSCLADIRGVIRKASKANPAIKFTLVVPSGIQREQRRRFGPLFDEGVSTPPGLLSPAVELLLVRGLAAAIAVVVPVADDVKVWVGRMSTRTDDLDRIERRLRWAEVGRTQASLWTPRSRAESAAS